MPPKEIEPGDETDLPMWSEDRRELVLAEYKALRDETLKRMDHRITLLVSSLTVSGAILGFGVERKDGTLLLVAPAMAVLFGLLILYHTSIIADIARHVAKRIEVPINAVHHGALGWHTRPERSSRFRGLPLLHLPIVLTTLAPTAAALALAWQFDGGLGAKIPLACLDVALLSAYLTLYIRRITQRAG